MRDLYIGVIYLAFLIFGMTAPFVATLGYVWVDTFYPQLVSGLVALIPTSVVMGGAALVFYVLLDRKSPARFTTHTFLTLLFSAWVTATLMWAEVPEQAWLKWDWAGKTIIFSAFIPIAIRSRIQIEAFLQVYLFAALFHMIPVGVKTLISGSAYGRSLGILQGNVGLAESSTLAAISIALIPIMLYLRAHAVLIPVPWFRRLVYLGTAVIAIPAAIGTYARTALVGFAVVGVSLFFQSRRKAFYLIGMFFLVVGFGLYAADSWGERIATTAEFSEESSALGRILVWQWTLGYVMENPLGGGFNSYLVDRITMPGPEGTLVLVYGKAFHNMYIEVLGEHGFPGLFMFVTLLFLSLLDLRRVSRRTAGQEHLRWLHDLSRAVMTALLTIMVCGCFIGIAFQAFVWYLIALPVCLREYLHRLEALERSAQPLAAGGSGRVAGPLVPAWRTAR